MQTMLETREETALKGKQWYRETIQQQIEIPENIGKMVIIDVDTGDFEVDDVGILSSHRLQERRPNARLYGIRIGYNVAESLGGVMERTSS